MKTIKYILFLLMLVPISVSANTYYSPYSEYTDYTTEEIVKTDLISVESKKFYQGYKELLIYEDESTTKEKTGNIKYENLHWQERKPDKYLEYKEKYIYYPYKEDRYYVFKNMGLSLLNIDRFIVNDLIDVSNIVLEPGETYEIAIPNGISSDKGMNILLNTQESTIKYCLSIKSDEEEIIFKDEEIARNSLLLTLYEFKSDIYKPRIISDVPLDIDGELKKNKMYLTGDILYEVKDIEYLDEYFENDEKSLIDTTKFIYKYRFKTRDKVEIKEILIENKEQKIEDFITSTAPYKIVSDINYFKNGIYNLKIITPFKTIEEKLIVDIKENYIALIEEITKENTTLTSALEEANYKVEKKNQEIKSIVNESNDQFLAIENEKLKTALKDIEVSKKDLGKIEKKRMNSIILVILMTILLIISLLRNKKIV